MRLPITIIRIVERINDQDEIVGHIILDMKNNEVPQREPIIKSQVKKYCQENAIDNYSWEIESDKAIINKVVHHEFEKAWESLTQIRLWTLKLEETEIATR